MALKINYITYSKKKKPSQHLPICPISTKLFGLCRKPLQSSAHPAKGTRSNTKGPHSKLGSYTTSPHQQLHSGHKLQSRKEFSGKETCEIQSHPDVIRRLATIFDRQPNGSGDPWEFSSFLSLNGTTPT